MKEKNEKYDVFISYSHHDYVDEGGRIIPGNIVSKIKLLLDENNISYWFDEDGTYSGDAWAPLLAKQIKDAKVFLFISTENSNSSEWTSSEIAVAHEYKKRIIPFRYDDSVYNDSIILYIARLDYIDYTKNHDKAFEKLISSIKEYLNEFKPAVDTTELSKVRQEIRETEDRLRLIRNDLSIQKARASALETELEIVRDYLNDLKIKEQKILNPDSQNHVPSIPTLVTKPSLFSNHHWFTGIMMWIVIAGLLISGVALIVYESDWFNEMPYNAVIGGLALINTAYFVSRLYRLKRGSIILSLLSVIVILCASSDEANMIFVLSIYGFSVVILSLLFLLKKDGISSWRRMNYKSWWNDFKNSIRCHSVVTRIYLLTLLLFVLVFILIHGQESPLLCTINDRIFYSDGGNYFSVWLGMIALISIWNILNFRKKGITGLLILLTIQFVLPLLPVRSDYEIYWGVFTVGILITFCFLLFRKSRRIWKCDDKFIPLSEIKQNWKTYLLVLINISVFIFLMVL